MAKLHGEIEKVHPNKVEYRNISDKGVTGRFEVTAYKTLADFDGGANGKVLHSKK